MTLYQKCCDCGRHSRLDLEECGNCDEMLFPCEFATHECDRNSIARSLLTEDPEIDYGAPFPEEIE